MDWLPNRTRVPLGVITDGEFHLGIGDPTPFAWVVVAGHGLAGLLALAVALHAARQRESRIYVGFWFLLAVALLLLAANKQLDLQTWFTQVGRKLARSEGWYERRRLIQSIFVTAIALVGLATIVLSAVVLRGHWRRLWLPFAGLAFLITFVIIRAASFHHVDRLLHARNGIWGLNQTLELGGAALILLGATRELWRSHPPPPTSPHPPIHSRRP